MFREGNNLMIVEIDVPGNGKKGSYGEDCTTDDVCIMSLDKVNVLLEDLSEPFGHGLCLVYCLLTDE